MRRSFALPLVLALAATAACSKKAPEAVTPDAGPARPAAAPPPPAARPTPPPAPPAAEPVSGNTSGAGTGGDTGASMASAMSTIGEMVFFDYNVADIRGDDRPLLDRKAEALGANPAVRIRVAGHADERGSDEYNFALGNRRAAAAKRYLESKGIDGGRIEIVSFGKERPLDPGHTEEAWARNRRAEFEVTAGGRP